MALYLLDLVNDVGGFFYTVFSFLGDFAVTELFDVLNNGFTRVYSNPLSAYTLSVNMTPQNSILGELLNSILQFVNLPAGTTILEFMLISVVLVFALVIFVRWISLFLPS